MLAGTMVLARLLTPSDFGIVAISVVVFVLANAALEGLIEYPILRVNNITEDKVRSLLWLGFGFSAVLGVSIFASANILEKLFKFEGLANVFRSIAPVFFVLAITVTGRAILRRQHRFRDVSKILPVSATIYVATAVLLALFGFQFWSLVIGQVLSFAIMAVLFGRTAHISLRPPMYFDLTELVSTSIHGTLSRCLAWFWSQIDTLAISLTSSAAVTGIYSRAYNLSTQVKEPFSAVDHPLRQAFIAVRERGEPLDTYASTALRLLTFGTASIASLLFVLRDLVIAVLLGDQWGEASLPFAILVAALPARIALQFIDSLTIASGRMQSILRRHILMCLFIGSGVAIAADYGIVSVSIVVAVALYTAILVPTGSDGGQRFPSRWSLILAMLPALVVFCSFVAVSEVLRIALQFGPIEFTLTISCLFAFVCLLVVLLVPDEWTVSFWKIGRERMLARLQTLQLRNRG